MTLLDSPLNKVGRLLIYLETLDGVIIEVNPQFRVPRTYQRFAEMMVPLLQYGHGDASRNLRLLPGPVHKYLPTGRKVALSITGHPVNLREWVDRFPQEELASEGPVSFIIGGVAQGDPTNELWEEGWVDDMISVSNFALTAASVCQKIVDEFEFKWNIV
eukprot:GEMP01048304.1.p1 GENE.GEMP01048304.1~~GEMP01048304.1.p1  ORF type:complete len:160 (+),score=40.07 GEMP01048304.1:396-875(+)